MEEICWVIWGSKGYIGEQVVKLLENNNIIKANSRLENRTEIINELEKIIKQFRHVRVLNIAGKTGVPNVDWCEDNKEETIRSNVIGTLNLADVCNIYNIHCTVFSSGCIYTYDDEHKIEGIPFTEEDSSNFIDSFYSKTKSLTEHFLKEYNNVLILRIRMPICNDINSSKNFIYKILRYKKVINIKNSMSYLPELLPLAIEMSKNNITGIYNFVNKNTISHNEILDLYIKYVDSLFKYENFSIEEQSKILKAPRSNANLSSDKLSKISIEIIHKDISDIKTSIEKLFKNFNTLTYQE